MKSKKSFEKNKKILIIGIPLFLVILVLLYNFFLVDSCANINTDKVEQLVLDSLESEGFANIAVSLNDDTCPEFTSNRTHNLLVINPLRSECYNEIENEVLSTLSDDEFTLVYKYSAACGFSGIINCKGLRKLVNNPLVESISLYGIIEAL